MKRNHRSTPVNHRFVFEVRDALFLMCIPFSFFVLFELFFVCCYFDVLSIVLSPRFVCTFGNVTVNGYDAFISKLVLIFIQPSV